MSAPALLLILLSALSFKANASCCSSSPTGGVGRLLAHERAAVIMSLSGRYLLGSFDDKASFTSKHSAHLPHLIIQPQLQLVARAFKYLEPFITLPARIQKSDKRTGANPADITIGARVPIAKDGELFAYLPAITLMSSLTIPSGTAFDRDRRTDIESITSTGDWSVDASVLLEKQWFNLSFALGYALAFSSRIFAATKPGLIHSPSLSIASPLFMRGFLSGSLSSSFHGPVSTAGTALAKSDRRKVSVGLAYSHRLHSHVAVDASASIDAPFPYVGKNFSCDAWLKLGVRFGFY